MLQLRNNKNLYRIAKVTIDDVVDLKTKFQYVKFKTHGFGEDILLLDSNKKTILFIESDLDSNDDEPPFFEHKDEDEYSILESYEIERNKKVKIYYK